MTLMLSNEDVERLLTMENCMEALEYAYGELGRDQAVMGPVIRVISPVTALDAPRPGGRRLFYAHSAMAAALPGWDVAANRQDSDLLDYEPTATGVRLVRIPASPGERFCGLILLHRVSTGELLAVIQDGFMQKTRVGGLAGVASKYLARRDADVLAIIGSGWQATAQVEAHCHARPIREVRVWSPHAQHREAFAAAMAQKVNAAVKAVATAEAAVRGASIVATATNSIEPVLFASWLEPGMFITSVKELEFEDAVYERCDLLVGNRRGPTWSRYVVGGADTIPEHGREIWHRWTQAQWKAVRLLGRVVAGREPGRTDDQQIIAFMNQGEGMQFAAVGSRLYELARAQGLGAVAPAEWFHQDKKYIP